MVLLVFLLFRMLLSNHNMSPLAKDLNISSDFVSEWVCVKESNGVSMHERWVKVNDSLNVRERKGVLEVNGSLDDIVAFLSDFETAKAWMKGIQKVDVFIEHGNSYSHIIIGLPWPFSDRDLIAQTQVFKNDGSHYTIKMKSVQDVVVESEDIVRIKDYKATWNITQIEDKKVHVEFQVFSADPPMFPQFVQEPVLKKIFYQNLLRLKEQLNALSK